MLVLSCTDLNGTSKSTTKSCPNDLRQHPRETTSLRHDASPGSHASQALTVCLHLCRLREYSQILHNVLDIRSEHILASRPHAERPSRTVLLAWPMMILPATPRPAAAAAPGRACSHACWCMRGPRGTRDCPTSFWAGGARNAAPPAEGLLRLSGPARQPAADKTTCTRDTAF